MKLPPNGSPLANASLILIGVVFGASMTWWLAPERNPDGEAPFAREGDPPRWTSVRQSGLTGRGDGAAEGGAARVVPAEMGAMERTVHFREAGAKAAEESLHGALAEAEGIESSRDRVDFVRGLYGEWAESDPEGALGHALSGMPAGQLQSDAIGIAINKWGQENPREAWMWAEKHLSGPLKERALTDLIIGWSRRNPREAADWLASTGLTSQPFFNALPGTWAESDPKAALAWVNSLPEGRAKETAEAAIAHSMAQNDPAAAAETFATDIQAGGNAAVVITIADIWASSDPASTAGWIADMPEGPGKLEAAATLATVWAANDISSAVEWSAGINDADLRRQVISNIGTTWGAIEPGAALEWLGGLPGDLASDGITGAMYSWAGTDPVGLREWIDSAAGDPLVDQARLSLGDVLSQSALPDAMDLAMGMSSNAARDEAMSRYFREWRKQDDASAQDWLDANWTGLSEATQGALQQVNAQSLQPR